MDKKPTDFRFLPRSDAEWTGLFLFAVGMFGVYHHSVMKHWTLWGVVPMDWLYFALLLGGLGLLIATSPLAPWADAEETRGGPILLGIARTLMVVACAAAIVLAAVIQRWG